MTDIPPTRVAMPGELPEGTPTSVEGTVVGEPVQLQPIPLFTEEQLAADRKNRTARTAEQAFPAAFAVTVAVWILLLAGLDLDPGEGNGLPPGVEAAWTGLLTWLASKWMNRTPR